MEQAVSQSSSRDREIQKKIKKKEEMDTFTQKTKAKSAKGRIFLEKLN